MASATEKSVHYARRKLVSLTPVLHGIVNKGAHNLGGAASVAAFLATERAMIVAVLRPFAQALISIYGHIVPLIKEEVGEVRKAIEADKNNYSPSELKNQFAIIDEMPDWLSGIFMSVIGGQKVRVLRNRKNGNRNIHELKCHKAQELIDKKLAKEEQEMTLKDAYEIELAPDKCCLGPKGNDNADESVSEATRAKVVDPRLKQIQDDGHQGYIERRSRRMSMTNHVTTRVESKKLRWYHLIFNPFAYWREEDEERAQTPPSSGTTLGNPNP